MVETDSLLKAAAGGSVSTKASVVAEQPATPADGSGRMLSVDLREAGELNAMERLQAAVQTELGSPGLKVEIHDAQGLRIDSNAELCQAMKIPERVPLVAVPSGDSAQELAKQSEQLNDLRMQVAGECITMLETRLESLAVQLSQEREGRLRLDHRVGDIDRRLAVAEAGGGAASRQTSPQAVRTSPVGTRAGASRDRSNTTSPQKVKADAAAREEEIRELRQEMEACVSRTATLEDKWNTVATSKQSVEAMSGDLTAVADLHRVQVIKVTEKMAEMGKELTARVESLETLLSSHDKRISAAHLDMHAMTNKLDSLYNQQGQLSREASIYGQKLREHEDKLSAELEKLRSSMSKKLADAETMVFAAVQERLGKLTDKLQNPAMDDVLAADGVKLLTPAGKPHGSPVRCSSFSPGRHGPSDAAVVRSVASPSAADTPQLHILGDQDNINSSIDVSPGAVSAVLPRSLVGDGSALAETLMPARRTQSPKQQRSARSGSPKQRQPHPFAKIDQIIASGREALKNQRKTSPPGSAAKIGTSGLSVAPSRERSSPSPSGRAARPSPLPFNEADFERQPVVMEVDERGSAQLVAPRFAGFDDSSVAAEAAGAGYDPNDVVAVVVTADSSDLAQDRSRAVVSATSDPSGQPVRASSEVRADRPAAQASGAPLVRARLGTLAQASRALASNHGSAVALPGRPLINRAVSASGEQPAELSFQSASAPASASRDPRPPVTAAGYVSAPSSAVAVASPGIPLTAPPPSPMPLTAVPPSSVWPASVRGSASPVRLRQDAVAGHAPPPMMRFPSAGTPEKWIEAARPATSRPAVSPAPIAKALLFAGAPLLDPSQAPPGGWSMQLQPAGAMSNASPGLRAAISPIRRVASATALLPGRATAPVQAPSLAQRIGFDGRIV
eukprot:TRINITY_DN22182_c0_g2_i1.p1 TRINITY_DN22182_c0_g2~~TRINITY_DN22182_c0_g2_i1.p1  ORF type:complete len:906 (-),score=205.64 TRINITY_DN22182_c0_g2_i1:239-2956(-)